MLPSSQLRDITIKDYLVIFKRRIWIIISCFIILTSFFTIRTFRQVPLYQAVAKILLEKTTLNIVPLKEVYESERRDREYMQDQINILNSRSLAKKVVGNLIARGDNSFVGNPKPELAFLGGVSVSIVQGTNLLNVGYISTDPIKAAKFANALVDTYIQQDVEKRVSAAKYATGWLETQIAEANKKLHDSETALNDYIKENNIVSLPDVEKKTTSILENLKQEKVNIGNEVIELSKRYKSKHPKMVALITRLEAVNKSIEEETKKLYDISDKMIKYHNLKREVEVNRSVYQSLLKRTKETEISKELETTNIRIIDLADVPKAPFSPNRRRDISMGAMLGLLLGVGLAFFLEYLDSTVKTAEDVEMYVRLPFLGYVPLARQEAKTVKDIDLISDKIPHSRTAEAYRSIRTSIIFSAPEDKPLKTILVTSTSPEEGKTTVSINLGIVFAHANEKTLILEADMRKPRLSGSWGIESKEGLSSFLAGTSSLETLIKQTSIANLSFIPSGPHPPNPAELLTSAKMRSLLEELKTSFDRIIIDSPPVITVADTAILANIVDGVIDVIRTSFRNIELILRGRQRLNEAKARIIGVILNNVNVKREDPYYYYHYYYAEEKEKKT